MSAAIPRLPRSIGLPRRARDEAGLIREAQRGSEDAVEALVGLHWDSAHRAAYLIVQDSAAAEDIAQEAMLGAVRALGGFDRRRSFSPWLHRIVFNRSMDWLRASARRPELATETIDLEPATTPDDPSLSEDLARALARLDHDVRGLIVLRHLLGYSSRELGRMFEMPPATVRTKLARGLDTLRLDLEGTEIA